MGGALSGHGFLNHDLGKIHVSTNENERFERVS